MQALNIGPAKRKSGKEPKSDEDWKPAGDESGPADVEDEDEPDEDSEAEDEEDLDGEDFDGESEELGKAEVDSQSDEGEYISLAEALDNSKAPAQKPDNLAIKKGVMIARKFGGTKEEPGYPDAGWVVGKLGKIFTQHCEVRYAGTPGGLVHRQKISGTEYLVHHCTRANWRSDKLAFDDDTVAPIGSWVFI